jgi:SOS-response transcriptional repressor LexA
MELRPTKSQRELLSFITTFIAEHSYGPSYREIMRALDYKSVSTVAVHVDNLIAKGWLAKRNRSARSLEVLSPTPATTVAVKITPAQEKWLIDLVFAHFDNAEKSPDQATVDNLYVLTGALQILGFVDAATSAKARLREFVNLSTRR